MKGDFLKVEDMGERIDINAKATGAQQLLFFLHEVMNAIRASTDISFDEMFSFVKFVDSIEKSLKKENTPC